MTAGLNSLDWFGELPPLRLVLLKFQDQAGEEQKGVDSWDKVVLYLDGKLGFKYPGAMSEGDCV